MGSSKQKTTSTSDQTQTSAPPTWTAPGLSEAAGMVTAGLGQIPTTHYSGPMVATMDPTALGNIQNAWNSTAANATGLADWMQSSLLPQLDQGMTFATALPSTDYTLAPRQDLNGVISASIDPVMRNLTDNILPGMTSSALESGAYSGNRAMGVLPTEAIRQAQDSAQRIASELGYTDYQNYENRRLQAYQATTGASQQNYALETQRQTAEATDRLQRLGMAPDMVNAILHTGASAGDLMKMAADLEMQNTQAGYNNAVSMDNYASQSPFMGLDTASQLLAQLSGGYGTQTGHSDSTQTTKTTPSLASQLIQGAVGIGSMAMGMPGMGGGGIPGFSAGAQLPVALSAGSSLFQPTSFASALQNLPH